MSLKYLLRANGKGIKKLSCGHKWQIYYNNAALSSMHKEAVKQSFCCKEFILYMKNIFLVVKIAFLMCMVTFYKCFEFIYKMQKF